MIPESTPVILRTSIDTFGNVPGTTRHDEQKHTGVMYLGYTALFYGWHMHVTHIYVYAQGAYKNDR